MRRLATAIAVILLATGFALAQGLERTLTIEMGEMYFQVPGQAQNAEIVLDTTVLSPEQISRSGPASPHPRARRWSWRKSPPYPVEPR